MRREKEERKSPWQVEPPPPRQTSVTFKRAPKAREKAAEQGKIFE